MSETDFRLRFQTGPQSGREYELIGDSITVGRYPLADIVISDPEIAYRHAVLTRGTDGYRIADLGSDAGTYINGQRVGAEPVPLANGDVILFGPRLSAAYLHGSIQVAVEEEPVIEEGEVAPGTLAPGTLAPGTLAPEVLAPEAMASETMASDWNNSSVSDAAADEPAVGAYEPSIWEAAPVERSAEQAPATPHIHPEPLPPMPRPHRGNGRIIVITAVVMLALFACCCSATAFMYFIGGDWLLFQLGYMP